MPANAPHPKSPDTLHPQSMTLDELISQAPATPPRPKTPDTLHPEHSPTGGEEVWSPGTGDLTEAAAKI
jgi:hypothetical protein